MAACLRHNSTHRRQAESDRGTYFLGRKERLKDTRQCNEIDSQNAIRDGKYDVLPGSTVSPFISNDRATCRFSDLMTNNPPSCIAFRALTAKLI